MLFRFVLIKLIICSAVCDLFDAIVWSKPSHKKGIDLNKNKKIKQEIESISVLVNPIQKVCDPGINSWKTWFGTFVTKRHNPNLSPSSVHFQHN